MKKVLSIALCLAMVLSLLPMSAFAEGAMDYAIADIAAPSAGQVPSYNASYGGTGYTLDAGNNNPNYYKNGVGWFDVTENKNVPVNGGTFVPGHEYKVMIFFAPKEGYSFDSSTTAQINGTDAEVALFENGTLLAELGFPKLPEKQDDPMVNPFKDVKESDYFYDAVLRAVDGGITTGTSATTFSPNDNCTRAQVVTFMWRAAGQQEVSSSNPFADVSSSEYYYKAVLWAVDRGITTGLSATSFGPNATCTRAQIVTFLYRFIGG